MAETARWAVVIGVDRYWKPEAMLHGAVRDALAMRDWLLSPQGGVPEENLALLLSPLEGKRRPPGAIDATKDNVVTAIVDVVRRSAGMGERITFYFAGHGFAARQDFTDEQALVTTDFTDVLTDNSITLRSLWDFFDAQQYENQFFFVDACRDPWPGERVVGRWPAPAQRAPGQDPVQQFTLYATAPGAQAVENAAPGEERGAFTESLLRALQGDGVAKAWDSTDSRYKVRWDSLVAYVTAEFQQRLLAAGANFQIPQAVGKSGVLNRESNPVIADFPAGTFPDQELTVFIEPEQVVPIVQVDVIDRDAGQSVAQKANIAGLPVTFKLTPNTYSLRASAPEHSLAVARPPVELYAPVEVRLSLTPAVPDAAAPQEPQPPPAPVPAGAAPGSPASLTVRSTDSLAVVEIADQTGETLSVGHGQVRIDDASPGFYRARLRTPEGDVQEQVVEVAPGDQEQVALEAPKGRGDAGVHEVAATVGLQRHDDNTLQVSERVGPVATPHLSTILTVGAAFQVQDSRGHHLDALGMHALENLPAGTRSAAYLVFGLESATESKAKMLLESVRVRAWSFGEVVPRRREKPKPFSDVPGLGELAFAREPGPLWLSIEVGEGAPAVFATVALPGRLTMLVFQHDPGTGHFRAYQYLPALGADPTSDPQFLRRLELMQRIALGGRLDLGRETAIDLLQGKETDPLAGCLGGYLLLRIGEAKRLRTPVANLARLYGSLSDVHVLQAEFEASCGHTEAAAAATERAIAAGIPIFGYGASLLLDALSAYRIDHPNARPLARVYDRRIKDSLWSVWVPDAMHAGKPLVD